MGSGEAGSLSARLRMAVAGIHDEIEAYAGIPGKILSLADYAGCLSRFYTIFEPVEHWLAQFREWPALGIDIGAQCRVPAILNDLATLGFDGEDLKVLDVPRPPSFAAALGALYVLEGSALGGKVVLRQIEARLGREVAGATTFFGGAGRASQLSWPAFKGKLDFFGTKRPGAQAQVIEGAADIFRWFGKALNLEGG